WKHGGTLDCRFPRSLSPLSRKQWKKPIPCSGMSRTRSASALSRWMAHSRSECETFHYNAAMLTPEQHLDNLVRHIEMVRSACLLLGKRLMARGRPDFARLLIARGFAHDASKFFGIEWEYLHAGPGVSEAQLE